MVGIGTGMGALETLELLLEPPLLLLVLLGGRYGGGFMAISRRFMSSLFPKLAAYAGETGVARGGRMMLTLDCTMPWSWLTALGAGVLGDGPRGRFVAGWYEDGGSGRLGGRGSCCGGGGGVGILIPSKMALRMAAIFSAVYCDDGLVLPLHLRISGGWSLTWSCECCCCGCCCPWKDDEVEVACSSEAPA